MGEAEWLPGGVRGDNQRFVVTSLERGRVGTQPLYEQLYCAGAMENRIKEQQLDLFADRTFAATMRANQLRLYRALFTAALLEVLWQCGLAATQFGTIRELLKLVRVSVRGSGSRCPRCCRARSCSRTTRHHYARSRRDSRLGSGRGSRAATHGGHRGGVSAMRLFADRAGHSGPEQVQIRGRCGCARGFPHDQAGKPVADPLPTARFPGP